MFGIGRQKRTDRIKQLFRVAHDRFIFTNHVSEITGISLAETWFILSQLEIRGWLVSEWEEGHTYPRRRMYKYIK